MLFIIYLLLAHEHEHGRVDLNIVVAEDLTLELEGPYDDFLGFEHPPRNKSEQSKIDQLVETFRTETLFGPNTDANCKLQEVSIEDNAVPKETEHSDLEATFTFKCTNIKKLNSIEVNLFSFYPDIEEVKVQLAASTQRAFTLNNKQRVIKW